MIHKTNYLILRWRPISFLYFICVLLIVENQIPFSKVKYNLNSKLFQVHSSPIFHCNFPNRPGRCGKKKSRCNLSHKGDNRQFASCQQQCPKRYPWINNLNGDWANYTTINISVCQEDFWALVLCDFNNNQDISTQKCSTQIHSFSEPTLDSAYPWSRPCSACRPWSWPCSACTPWSWPCSGCRPWSWPCSACQPWCWQVPLFLTVIIL